MARPLSAEYSAAPQHDTRDPDAEPRVGYSSVTDASGGRGSLSGRILYGVVAVLLLCGSALAVSAGFSAGRDANKVSSAGFLTGKKDVIQRFDVEALAPEGSWVREQVDRSGVQDHYDKAMGKISEKWHLRTAEIGKLRDPNVTEIPENHIMTLYHQTSPEACAGIVATGFRLGKGAWCGKGAYFALSPIATKLKSVAPSSGHGCMLESKVDVGKIGRFASCGLMNTMDGYILARQGYDSILFEPPEATGDEVIIFDTTRILSTRIVPFQAEWLSERWYGNNGGWR